VPLVQVANCKQAAVTLSGKYLLQPVRLAAAPTVAAAGAHEAIDRMGLGKPSLVFTGNYLSSWDLHFFFIAASREEKLGLWRHPMVAAFWDIEFLLHALAADGRLAFPTFPPRQ